MVRITAGNGEPKPVEFEVRHAGRSVRRTYQQVFESGYELWQAKNYAEALKVFESLIVVTDRGPRAHIMLSHCKAMLGDYGGCSSTLTKVLSDESSDKTAMALHDAFVMWKCSFYLDAKKELENIISKHSELPTPCLMLADLLSEAGNDSKSICLLKMAIQRDRPKGAIATIACKKLRAAELRIRLLKSEARR